MVDAEDLDVPKPAPIFEFVDHDRSRVSVPIILPQSIPESQSRVRQILELTAFQWHVKIGILFICVCLAATTSHMGVSFNTMNFLLEVLVYLFSIFGIHGWFPKNMRALQRMIGVEDKLQLAETYLICCPKCGTVRTFDECIIRGVPDRVLTCSTRIRPSSSRYEETICKSPLLVPVVTHKLAGGHTKIKYMPFTSAKYNYPGLVLQLRNILKRPEVNAVLFRFLVLLLYVMSIYVFSPWQVFWHHLGRKIPEGWLADVYDGTWWLKRQTEKVPIAGGGFLKETWFSKQGLHTCALTINTDGFQVFEHTPYT